MMVIPQAAYVRVPTPTPCKRTLRNASTGTEMAAAQRPKNHGCVIFGNAVCSMCGKNVASKYPQYPTNRPPAAPVTTPIA